MHCNTNLTKLESDIIALAVSGGADSIAMLYMMHDWSKLQNKTLIILTVNHNLRIEAKRECEYVKECCDKLGLKHIILDWVHDGITSNIHDQARDARYNLMTNWCNNNNVTTLCTAHHMDDRIENFFIRISRGAGILGLIDKDEIIYNKVNIIRPLFGYKKIDLISYLNNHNIKWCEDKSNYDNKYLRTNIRKWLNDLPDEIDRELFKNRVIYVKNNLDRAAKVIERIYNEELEDKVKFHNNEKATLSSLPQDQEIAFMILSHVITIIGESKTPRLESIELLYNNLISSSNMKSTLGGCIIEKKGSEIIFRKEDGRKI